MALRTCRGIVLLASVCLFGGAVAHGNVIYDESVSGDVSAITLLPGTETLGPLGESFIGIEAGRK